MCLVYYVFALISSWQPAIHRKFQTILDLILGKWVECGKLWLAKAWIKIYFMTATKYEKIACILNILKVRQKNAVKRCDFCQVMYTAKH